MNPLDDIRKFCETYYFRMCMYVANMSYSLGGLIETSNLPPPILLPPYHFGFFLSFWWYSSSVCTWRFPILFLRCHLSFFILFTWHARSNGFFLMILFIYQVFELNTNLFLTMALYIHIFVDFLILFDHSNRLSLILAMIYFSEFCFLNTEFFTFLDDIVVYLNILGFPSETRYWVLLRLIQSPFFS